MTSDAAPAAARRYALVHRTTYAYDDVVTASFGLTHLLPRATEHQRPLTAVIEVEPAAADIREHTDFFGNRAAYVEVETRHTRLVVTARSEVEVMTREAVDLTALATPWEAVRDALAAPAGATSSTGSAGSTGSAVSGGSAGSAGSGGSDSARLEAQPFRLTSPLVPDWPQVRAFAASVFTPARPIGAALGDLVRRIHDDFAYAPGATTVATTLPEVLAARAGVCQDFAHLAVGMLRSVGLAARYVSGYLETTPPPGRARLVGADASHAWVAAYLPGLGWLELDPTNGKQVDGRYVVVAHGRDYGDVTPVKGVIFTDSTKSSLRVEVDLSLLP